MKKHPQTSANTLIHKHFNNPLPEANSKAGQAIAVGVLLACMVVLIYFKWIRPYLIRRSQNKWLPFGTKGFVDMRAITVENKNTGRHDVREVPEIPSVKIDKKTGVITVYPVSRTMTTPEAVAEIKFLEKFFKLKIADVEFEETPWSWRKPWLMKREELFIYPDKTATNIQLSDLLKDKKLHPYISHLGINARGENVIINQLNDSLTLISGGMGSGKSTELRNVILEALKADPFTRVIIVSSKKGNSDFHAFKQVAEVIDIDTEEGFLRYCELAKELENEMTIRIKAYEELPPEQHHAFYTNKFHRILLINDECKQYLSREMAGSNKEKRAKIDDLVAITYRIATLGRSSGITLWCALQQAAKSSLDLDLSIFNTRIASNTETDEMSRSLFGSTIANNPLHTKGIFVGKFPGQAGAQKFKAAFADRNITESIVKEALVKREAAALKESKGVPDERP